MSSVDFYSLCKAQCDPLWHIVNMQDDKNGGPNNLEAWRRYRRMSQQQLADAVGTSISMISHLETGERGLSSKWLRRLAPALGTTPGFLLDHDPNDLPRDILAIWNRADPGQQRQIAAVAEAMIGFDPGPPTPDDPLDALAKLAASTKAKRKS